jgi:ribonuclease G
LHRELLIAAGPGEWRAALLEDGAAVELYIERGDTRVAGSIQLGRVVRLAPGLDSAFVEIGDARPGIVPLREATADGIRLDEGARVIVEVRREAQQDKGARLSTRLGARAGLDLQRLRRQAGELDPPTQLYPAAGLAAALAMRLPGRPDRVAADDRATIRELQEAFPTAEIETNGEWPIDLDAVIEAALAPSLALPKGGTVHLQEARAATIVDVDTGNPAEQSAAAGAIAANLNAAALIARQLRLRNIGGAVVIDFVGLEAKARDRVRSALAAALRADRLQPRILGWTRLGHLEVVRPRRGRSLSDALLEPEDGTARRKRPVTLALEALRAVSREARARPGANWQIRAAPAVAAALSGSARPALEALESRLGRAIAVTAAADRDFDIVPL